MQLLIISFKQSIRLFIAIILQAGIKIVGARQSSGNVVRAPTLVAFDQQLKWALQSGQR